MSIEEDSITHFGVKGMRWGIRKQKIKNRITQGFDAIKIILNSPEAQRNIRSLQSEQLKRQRTEAVLRSQGQIRAKALSEARRKDRESVENRLEKVRRQSDDAESRRRIIEMNTRS